MKLSMWMIANRLSGFDLDLQIDAAAPIVLRSARSVYATNCVYVYPDGEDSVCKGEGGAFVIKGMSPEVALQIVQSVFDFYDDWDEEIRRCFSSLPPDFQRAIDMSDSVFRNPMLISDSNYKVLGISRQYPEDSVDEEWKLLITEGYHSIDAVMSLSKTNYNFSIPKAQHIRPFFNNRLQKSCISAPIIIDKMTIARLSVLCHTSQANPGYIQLVEHLAQAVTSSIQIMSSDSRERKKYAWFLGLIEGLPLMPDHILERHLSYVGLDNDARFYLCAVEGVEGAPLELFEAAMRNILSLRLKCVSAWHEKRFIILADYERTKPHHIADQLELIIGKDMVRLGISLPFDNLENIPEYLCQTDTALSKKQDWSDSASISSYYYDCALDDMIVSSTSGRSHYSCHPDVRKLIEVDKRGNTDYLNTLYTFLLHERNIAVASQELFIHRNTLVYRIKKIEDIIEDNLDDPYARLYMLHSIKVQKLLCSDVNSTNNTHPQQSSVV